MSEIVDFCIQEFWSFKIIVSAANRLRCKKHFHKSKLTDHTDQIKHLYTQILKLLFLHMKMLKKKLHCIYKNFQ